MDAQAQFDITGGLMRIPLQERLQAFHKIQWHWTAGRRGQESTFRRLVEQRKPTNIVEIGTHQGVSTALLAEYGQVTTVDILPSPLRSQIWGELGVTDRVTSHVCKSSKLRDNAIAEAVVNAQLAFVDGCHLMPDVIRDFNLTIPCGYVILHDYWDSDEDWPDVREFVDGIAKDPHYTVEVHPPFALVYT